MRKYFDEWGMHETLMSKTSTNGLYVGFIGETLRGKASRKKLDKSLAIRQIC